MGPVAPEAGLRTLVGELGDKVSLLPEVVVRLLGLTMRTMEGPLPVPIPPLPLTGMAWPLFERRMILLPPPPAAVDVATTVGGGDDPGAEALEVVVGVLDVITTGATCAPLAPLTAPPGVGALM